MTAAVWVASSGAVRLKLRVMYLGVTGEEDVGAGAVFKTGTDTTLALVSAARPV
jgi:hypothetical protein